MDMEDFNMNDVLGGASIGQDTISGIPFYIKPENQDDKPKDDDAETEETEEEQKECIDDIIYKEADPSKRDEYYYFSSDFQTNCTKTKMKQISPRVFRILGTHKIRKTYDSHIKQKTAYLENMGFEVMEIHNTFADGRYTKDHVHILFICQKKC